jgi:hypothetical protein
MSKIAMSNEAIITSHNRKLMRRIARPSVGHIAGSSLAGRVGVGIGLVSGVSGGGC